MEKIRKHITKKIRIVTAITLSIMVIFLLAMSLSQAKEANELVKDTMELGDGNKEELMQELLQVSEYLKQMDETVVTNQESINAQLRQKLQIQNSDVQILFKNKEQFLTGQIIQLHNQINSTQEELDLLLSEMEVGEEARNKEEKEAFADQQKSLTRIQDDVESFDSLKNKMTYNFQNMGADVSEQMNTLNNNLINQYESLTTIVNTGDDDLNSYLDNIFGNVNQKLESVFTSVSSGKRLLASALLTKGVSCKEDATFQEIYQNILHIPQKLVLGVEEIPGSISYDYHDHVDGSGGNPHMEQNQQSGGCYTIPIYHVHKGNSSITGGCYTIPIYHTHTSGCYSEGNHNGSCPSHTERHSYDCGTVHDYDGDGHGCDGFTVYDCGGHRYLSCNQGSGIIGHSLGCGKNNSSIDFCQAGCGFSDGQIIAAHILYTGNPVQTMAMNLNALDSVLAIGVTDESLQETVSGNMLIKVEAEDLSGISQDKIKTEEMIIKEEEEDKQESMN